LAARSAAEAIEARRGAAARALACVSRLPVRTGGGWRAGEPIVLALGEGAAIKLGSDGGLSFAASEQIVAHEGEAGWEARTVAYMYVLGVGEAELLAFHWHPAGPSAVRTPHLHIGAEVQLGAVWLAKAHVPTGMVALADVLALALGELGVRPLRDDWQGALAEAKGA
jgi:hypothetical protein